jgi:uronate dehydrogenase
MRVLLTGATGSVGRQLRPFLAETYKSVLLTSPSPITDLRANERHLAGDICDPELVDTLMSQVDGVVHLAGLVGPDYTFEQVLQPNIVACYQLFETVRRRGVKRIIYASSHHAVGFLPRDVVVNERTPPRADSWYGVSKACGLDVMCIRIGYVGGKVPDERRLHTWSSARDLAALIGLGLTGALRGFHLVYGASRCPDPLFDNTYAESLGYRPRDCSLDYLADPAIAQQRPDPANPDHRYIGGHFAARHFNPGEAK